MNQLCVPALPHTVPWLTSTQEEPIFPLVDIPDAEVGHASYPLLSKHSPSSWMRKASKRRRNRSFLKQVTRHVFALVRKKKRNARRKNARKRGKKMNAKMILKAGQDDYGKSMPSV